VRVGVAHHVDQDPVAALGLALLVRQPLRVALHGRLGHVARELAHRVEPGAALQRHYDVVAARAGGHDERLQPELAQQRPELDRGAAHVGGIPARIQIEDQAVRAVEAVGPGSATRGG
jgi:hypothetical protein